MPRPGWENIADLIDLSKPEAKKNVKVGKTLTFKTEGSLHHYKVMQLPKNGNIWVKRITLMSEANFKSHYGHNVDTTQVPMWCTDCDEPVDNQ